MGSLPHLKRALLGKRFHFGLRLWTLFCPNKEAPQNLWIGNNRPWPRDQTIQSSNMTPVFLSTCTGKERNWMKFVLCGSTRASPQTSLVFHNLVSPVVLWLLSRTQEPLLPEKPLDASWHLRQFPVHVVSKGHSFSSANTLPPSVSCLTSLYQCALKAPPGCPFPQTFTQIPSWL